MCGPAVPVGLAAALSGTGVAAGGAATAGLLGGMSALQLAGLGASVVGTGMQAYGQYQQGKAAQNAARYNQQVAEIQGRDAISRGEYEAESAGRKISALRGRQRAALAANGLDLNEGTPDALLEQTDYYGLEDQRTIANNARREAAMYSSRAGAYGAEARSINPRLAATGTLLAGGGAVADRWYNYTRKS